VASKKDSHKDLTPGRPWQGTKRMAKP